MDPVATAGPRDIARFQSLRSARIERRHWLIAFDVTNHLLLARDHLDALS